ncbi:MAG: transporter [Ancrocorticia sp.]|jgi:putative transport protein|nr:transporter [Ancrocorticia sp.]MCI1933028.1 transporter [Ancrocorticia sp.]MCI1964414.1 transporter [Ancrocorticia sp.]MCI2003138.1 transporter [Ancrocorticia sp.]MCI2012922.1 transporter [Ancrocorticia sp.]
MTSIFTYLSEQPVVLLFALIGLGMIIGQAKIKGVGLGAAAVLFLAIGIAAWAQGSGIEVTVPAAFGSLGLTIFAFAIGNNSGASFFKSLKKAAGPIATMVALFVVAAAVAVLVGKYVFHMSPALIAGTYAGALTNTPALSAAGESSGDAATATIGYAVAYLFGVIGMIGAAMWALRYSGKDADNPTPVTHANVRIERTDRPTVAAFLGELDGAAEISRLRRGEQGEIWVPADTDVLECNDLMTVVGEMDVVNQAINRAGHESSHSLRADRRCVDFRRITISEAKLAGMSVKELDDILEERWHAKISRVRRGDTDMLAIPELLLEMGDRVRVVGPTRKLKEISRFLGDSSRGLTYINPIALGLGLALGVFIGEIDIPMPGGGSFSLGAAAGVLIVGLIMGRIGRIGPMVTALPNTANAVLSEFGLLMFLAQAGTNAGGQISQAFTSGDWWKILVLGVVVTSVMALGLCFTMRYLFTMGGTQLSGLLGGAQTQPAVLAFANGRTGADPRVALGYALVYPVAMIGKILVAHFLGGL